LLRLNTAVMNQTGTGQIMNLLNNDVIRFDQLTMYLNYYGSCLLILYFTAIGTIMWQKVGISSFVGIGTLLIIVLDFELLESQIQNDCATDRRVQLMSELIAGIQVVKMYAWEKSFSQIVSVIRKLEIKQIKFSSYVRAAYLAIIVFAERLTVYFTLSEITPQLQFKSQKPKEESNAENQIDRYISRKRSIVLSEHQRLSDLPVYVKLQRVSANWISGQLPPTLCNINLTIKPGQLCAVIGTVGSGKSSILHLLLKELNPGSGSIILTQGSKYNFPGNLFGYFTNNPNLRISYASQEPWLFGDTVRDNVLFEKCFFLINWQMFQVANVCALKKDFRQFPQRDMTMVGDRGVSLSGGQKARINLARAVYRQADIYLLDDPLSAVDTRMKFKYLGFVKMQENYNKLVQSNKDFIEMLDNLNQAQRKEEENMRRASEMSKRITITKLISRLSITNSITHSDIDDSDYVENIPEAEMTAHGRLASRVYKEYLHNGGNNFTLLVLLMIFIISQVATTGNDYWLSYWTTLEDVRRIENISDVKQFANMYNDSFLGSIFDGLLSTVDAIYVYTFCIIACIATTLFRSFLYMKVSMNSSSNLHNIMFFKLLQAYVFLPQQSFLNNSYEIR
ncbi:MRP4 protein, partial [Acromyrmex insinuator]